MPERKLATIRQIDAIKPIEGADKIELAIIGGWQVVVNKDLYQPGSLVVFCEIDSWIPHELAPFLSKGKEPKEFEGVKGERLRTIKLKGCISQGLVLPIQCCIDLQYITPYLCDDVTELLCIKKWEKPIPVQLRGQVKGNFPSGYPKTDQERIQNLSEFIGTEQQPGAYKEHLWSLTEKLHGSSCTFILDSDGEFHVCSRNLDLKEDATNAYWKLARKINAEEIMRQHNLYGYAIQGEMLGEGINGNNYKKDLEFYAFDAYDSNTNMYLLPGVFQALMQKIGFQQVPVLNSYYWMPKELTVASILSHAEGQSSVHGAEGVQREGIVWRSHTKHDLSFKAVSNAWLQQYE